MNNLRFDTLHQAAIGVQKACDKSSMPDLHLLPYSRFSAEDSSLWWLVSTKSRTAFKQGKFVLGKPDRFGFDSGIVCGLHVERGVKQTVGSADWKLGADWQWHNFVNDMHGPVPDAVASIGSLIAEPVELFVHASTDGPRNFDRLRFTSTGPSITAEHVDLHLNALKETASCRSWIELSRNLEFLPASADWYWIDVFLVARFSLDPLGSDNMDVCVRFLESIQRWLGSS